MGDRLACENGVSCAVASLAGHPQPQARHTIQADLLTLIEQVFMHARSANERPGEWLEAMLAGIAVGMSMLPEEFPVVLAVFMAMGAWRIGKVGVLTRRAAAIETLGSATVLCTDKTGTLTN